MKWIWILFACSSLSANAPFIIGICGGSCSGKSTFTKELSLLLSQEISILSQDSYYYPKGNRPADLINYDHPDAIDFPLLTAHLKELLAGRAIEMPIYHFDIDDRLEGGVVVEPHPVILIEGHLLFAIPEIRELLSLKIFVETDDQTRFLRRIERDLFLGRPLERIFNQYRSHIYPMHLEYVEPYRLYSDLIIPGVSDTKAAQECLLSRIRDLIKTQTEREE